LLKKECKNLEYLSGVSLNFTPFFSA